MSGRHVFAGKNKHADGVVSGHPSYCQALMCSLTLMNLILQLVSRYGGSMSFGPSHCILWGRVVHLKGSKGDVISIRYGCLYLSGTQPPNDHLVYSVSLTPRIACATHIFLLYLWPPVEVPVKFECVANKYKSIFSSIYIYFF